jgi:hypothetical protein
MNHSELFKTARGLFKQGESAKALHLLGEAMGRRKRAETPPTMVASGSAAA